jgi:Family of unknown function (DUF6680)
MTASQFWIYMFTIMLAPLIAVQVTEYLQKHKEARARKFWLFRTLMATRATKLSLEHVQALNTIDIEFRGTGKRFKAVVEAWKAYLNHLNTQMPPDAWQLWASRRDDLFVDLLYSMAQSLGYSMDKTDLRSTSYFPIAHGRTEDEYARIRAALLELLDAKRPLLVKEDQNPSEGPRPGA